MAASDSEAGCGQHDRHGGLAEVKLDAATRGYSVALVERGDIRLTDAGKAFAAADLDVRKRLFARHLAAYVPLAAHIRRVLEERASHQAPKSRFLDELEDHMTDQYAEATLRAVISWARYAELFEYDDDTGIFRLEAPTG